MIIRKDFIQLFMTEEFVEAALNLFFEIEGWGVPQTDESGQFGPETALGKMKQLVYHGKATVSESQT